MGERKVLNKYYPPDFDPAKLPRGKRPKNNEMKVRMMLPMSVRCNTCGNFMYKGTKFNTTKQDVAGENYLGIQVFRFIYRCSKCAAEFSMKTDPKAADYVMETGATRNYEPWREKDAAVADAKAAREEEERGNAMKALENRTLDSKREMDIMAALDEMRSLRARHAGVTPEQALAALQAARQEGQQEGQEQEELPEEDRQAMAQFFAQQATIMRRLSDSEEDEEGDQPGPSGRAGNGAGSSQQLDGGAGSRAAEAAGLSQQQQQQQQQQRRQQQQDGNGASTSGQASTAMPPPKAVVRPAVKVMVKAKRPAAEPAAAQQQAPAAKRQKEEGGAAAKGGESPGGSGGGLLGLVSYGDSDDSS